MDRKFNNTTMLIACKEITKNPDNLVKIFSYFGYLRENEGEGGEGWWLYGFNCRHHKDND